MPNPFDLLDLADGESGEAAVAKVVCKKKAEEAAKAAANPKHHHHNHHGQYVKEQHRGQDQENGRGRGYNYDHYNRNYYENGQYQHKVVYGGDYGYGEHQADGYNNGHRQGYSGGQSRRKNLQYRPKKQVSETASSVDGESKSGEKLELAGETEKKESVESVAGADAKPTSGSNESAGDVVKDDSKKGRGEGDSQKKVGPSMPRGLSGSAKKKWRKENSKSGGSKGKKSEKEPERTNDVKEEETKDMTLEEYEKVLEEKKKALETLISEGRVTAEKFEGMQVLEKKKSDDKASKKAENDQNKDGGARQVKAPKAINLNEFIKPADGQEYVPRPPRRVQEDGFSHGHHSGGGAGRGRGNGGFRQHSRDNGTEPQSYNAGRGGNRRVTHDDNGGGAPRNGYPSRLQNGYNGRGNGYNGGYHERRDGYNGGYHERGNARYQQHGGHSGNSNGGGFRQEQAVSSGNGNGGYRRGGYQNQSQNRAGNGRRPSNGDPPPFLSATDFPSLA